jgi:hypothetical protein
MMRKRNSLAALLVFTLALLPATAGAQPRGAFDACSGKEAGDDCTVGPGLAGVCTDHGRGAFCVPSGGPRGDKGGDKGGGKGSGMQGMRAGQDGRRPARSTYPAPGTREDLLETAPKPTGGAFDTHQRFCFDDSGPMACPDPGERYYGRTPSTSASRSPTRTTPTAPSRTTTPG